MTTDAPPGLLLRTTAVTDRDLEQIADLLQAGARRGLRSPGEVAEQFRSAARVVRAHDARDGRLVGVAWVLRDGLGAGWVADAFVAEDRRGEGIGAALIERLQPVRPQAWLVAHDGGPTYVRAAGT